MGSLVLEKARGSPGTCRLSLLGPTSAEAEKEPAKEEVKGAERGADTGAEKGLEREEAAAAAAENDDWPF